MSQMCHRFWKSSGPITGFKTLSGLVSNSRLAIRLPTPGDARPHDRASPLFENPSIAPVTGAGGQDREVEAKDLKLGGPGSRVA